MRHKSQKSGRTAPRRRKYIMSRDAQFIDSILNKEERAQQQKESTYKKGDKTDYTNYIQNVIQYCLGLTP
jgi:hypothetical protein